MFSRNLDILCWAKPNLDGIPIMDDVFMSIASILISISPCKV